MTDTIQDFSAPVPAPEVPTEPSEASQRGRPSRVVQRDLAIARALAEEERSLHAVMAALGLAWRVTYNSVCRLRDQGLVELNRNGTRTPTWRVTERGHAWLGTTTQDGEPPPAPEPAPVEAPTPAPEPEAVVPEPGAEVVPISPPEPPEAVPTPVAEVPQPAAPQPEPPGTVAPSPGPTEPVWPV